MVYLHNPTSVSYIYEPKEIIIPKDMLTVHGYHPKFCKLKKKLAKQRLAVLQKIETL